MSYFNMGYICICCYLCFWTISDESLLGGTPDSLSDRSQSDIFAELDDLAPRSSSFVSPDHPAGSQTDRSSPITGNTTKNMDTI